MHYLTLIRIYYASGHTRTSAPYTCLDALAKLSHTFFLTDGSSSHSKSLNLWSARVRSCLTLPGQGEINALFYHNNIIRLLAQQQQQQHGSSVNQDQGCVDCWRASAGRQPRPLLHVSNQVPSKLLRHHGSGRLIQRLHTAAAMLQHKQQQQPAASTAASMRIRPADHPCMLFTGGLGDVQEGRGKLLDW